MLSGCVGSYVVFQDEDPQPFETLHAVPDRHTFTSQKIYTQEELHLKAEHQKNILIRNEERKKAQPLQNQSDQGAPLKEK